MPSIKGEFCLKKGEIKIYFSQCSGTFKRKMSSKSIGVLLESEVKNWKIPSKSVTISLGLETIRAWEEGCKGDLQ